MPATTFTAASNTLTTMSGAGASTDATTTILYNNIQAATQVAEASSTANGISASAYASAAPTHIFNQVKNMYTNCPNLRNGGAMPLPGMSLALKCVIGVCIVDGCATAVYRRIAPADVPPDENPQTWQQKLDHAWEFLNKAAAENEQLREDMAHALEEIGPAKQAGANAASKSGLTMWNNRNEDKYISTLETQCHVYDKELKGWRNEARQLRILIDQQPDLAQQLIDSQAETAHLRGVNLQLENEKNDLQMDYDIYYAELETKLKNEKDEVVAQLNAAKEGSDDMNGELEEAHQHADRLHYLLEQSVAIMEKKKTALKKAQTDIMELEKINAEQKDLGEQYEEELVASKQDHDDKVNQLKGQVKTTATDLNEAFKKHTKYEDKIKELTDLLNSAAADRDDERKKSKKLEDEVARLTELATTASSERDEERKKSKDLEEQVSELEARLSAPSPSPQHSQRGLDLTQSLERASTPSASSFKASSSASKKLLSASVASHAHKSPLLDVPPSALSSLLQATNAQETTIGAGESSSSQHHEATHSPASSFMGQVTHQDPPIAATPIISASQEQLNSSPSNSPSDNTPSKKRARAPETGPEAGPVSDDGKELCVKRTRVLASPRKRDSPSPPPTNEDTMEDTVSAISSSQVPTLDLANKPTFPRPDTARVPTTSQDSAPSFHVPAPPASPTRRTSRLPVVAATPAAEVSPSRRSTRTATQKYGSYNESAMIRASSPVKDAEVPASAVAASSQQSEGVDVRVGGAR